MKRLWLPAHASVVIHELQARGRNGDHGSQCCLQLVASEQGKDDVQKGLDERCWLLPVPQHTFGTKVCPRLSEAAIQTAVQKFAQHDVACKEDTCHKMRTTGDAPLIV